MLFTVNRFVYWRVMTQPFLVGLIMCWATSIINAQPPRSIEDRVYSVGQARIGGEEYQQSCAACHPSDQATHANAPELTLENWRGATLWEFADYTENTMPLSSPGRLTPSQVNAITAYILQINGYEAGDDNLVITLDDPIVIK